MEAPSTPTRGNGVVQTTSKAGGPRTPSANRLAVAERGVGARVERGETAPVDPHFQQSARAWRSGGDRKIMFDNRGGHALTPEAQRPPALVAIMHVCGWLLIAAGMFQIVMSKCADFRYPLHWVGVLMLLLGLVSTLVRVYTNRCGTNPKWSAGIAVATVAACLSSWLLADGPLYKEVKTAEVCTDENVRELCGYEEVDEDALPEDIPDLNVCVCRVASGAWDLCVDFTSNCENITSDRRFLLMSLISLWVGLGLAFIVAVVSMRVVATTYDAAAIAKAEEKKLMKAKFARDSATAAPPFGGPV
ncbi:unnamed protein product [Ectocarpus sp. CCAP 1310/34]|nr:unnamed protein product [Ectocarpus sp. CCAP 1310/34]